MKAKHDSYICRLTSGYHVSVAMKGVLCKRKVILFDRKMHTEIEMPNQVFDRLVRWYLLHAHDSVSVPIPRLKRTSDVET